MSDDGRVGEIRGDDLMERLRELANECTADVGYRPGHLRLQIALENAADEIERAESRAARAEAERDKAMDALREIEGYTEPAAPLDSTRMRYAKALTYIKSRARSVLVEYEAEK